MLFQNCGSETTTTTASNGPDEELSLFPRALDISDVQAAFICEATDSEYVKKVVFGNDPEESQDKVFFYSNDTEGVSIEWNPEVEKTVVGKYFDTDTLIVEASLVKQGAADHLLTITYSDGAENFQRQMLCIKQ